MSEEFCHVSVRSHSPAIVDPPPPASPEEDRELSQLVEDFMRATQLQISLKQRIDSFLERKEKEAEEQEEKARLLWVASQATKKSRQSSAILLREKMKQAENMGKVDKEKADDPPPMVSPISLPIASNGERGRSPARVPTPIDAPPTHIETMKPPPSLSVRSNQSRLLDSPPGPPDDLYYPPPKSRTPSPPRRSPGPPFLFKRSNIPNGSSSSLSTASKVTEAGSTHVKSGPLTKPSPQPWFAGAKPMNKNIR